MARYVCRISGNTSDGRTVLPSSSHTDNALQTGINTVNNYYAGVHYDNLMIPQGTTISNATLHCWARPAGGTTADENEHPGYWYGDDADERFAWGFSTGYPDGITKTAASVEAKIGNADKKLLSHDFTALVQEIINRPGWTPGNGIRFATDPAGATGYTTYYDYNDDQAYSPVLVIDTPTDITGLAQKFQSAWAFRRLRRIPLYDQVQANIRAGSTGKEVWTNWIFPGQTIVTSGPWFLFF